MMLFNCDCRDVLDLWLPDNSVDSIVTDPPYGLSFMGKKWDYDVPGLDVWQAAYRVLKPGGYLLAFFGTRTYHRGVVPIEDAGFEIRDQVGWAYGSGFPKSHNGPWGGTALKPAWEPIVMARKPLVGTVEDNWTEWGTGALNIDGCRVNSGASPSAAYRAKGKVPSSCKPGEYGDGHAIQNRITPERWLEARPGEELGRWPANLIHDGSDEVLAEFPQAPGQMAKAAEGGDRRKDQNVYGAMTRGFNGAEPRADSGSAARFFYCPKAGKSDRGAENTHPTVKPTELMRYLCRLVTPVGGVVLDPFMGSGSTGKAAVLEGFKFIGCELDAEYFAIAEARIVVGESGPAK